jgi:C1A family cysteine protease
MADCQKYFATNDPKNIEVVKSTLRKMDANFQRGKCQVQFFHRNDTPPLSIFLKSNQGADVFAYTTLGGQTMHAPSWKAHGYSPNTIVHEMSHMAAHTHDYGYSNTGDLYWTTEGECKKLTTHQLLRNADTYALFIEMDIPQVARSWKTTEAWRANR